MVDLGRGEPDGPDSAVDPRRAIHEIVLRLAPRPRIPLTAGARLIDDLAYHSLALLELAFALEKEFGLAPLDGTMARRIRTVADVEDYVMGELRVDGRSG